MGHQISEGCGNAKQISSDKQGNGYKDYRVNKPWLIGLRVNAV